jgi:hypothetical protein
LRDTLPLARVSRGQGVKARSTSKNKIKIIPEIIKIDTKYFKGYYG